MRHEFFETLEDACELRHTRMLDTKRSPLRSLPPVCPSLCQSMKLVREVQMWSSYALMTC